MGETAAGTRLESLESWSPALFLVAGAILVVYATLHGMEAFLDAAYPMVRDGVIRPVGYALGFVAVLGLHPSLADRRSWLARAGAAAAVLGLVAFSVFTAYNLAELAGVASGDPPGWAVFTVMAASGFVVGYLAVGVAVLRSGTYPRIVGLLLLMPGVIIVLMIASIVADLASPESVFVVSAGQAMTHLAIGATLHVEGETADREAAESAADATAKG